MFVSAIILIASMAPTPIGVVTMTTGKRARALQADLDDTLRQMLIADDRFQPLVLPEVGDEKIDLPAARAAMDAGRDAFLILETEESQRQLKIGSEGLFLGLEQLDQRSELLDAWAQRVGILLALDDERGAREVAVVLGRLDPDYVPEGVEFVDDRALELIARAQKRALRERSARGKAARIVVKKPKRGPAPEVRIDNQALGRAPISQKVAAGWHVVTLHLPGMISRTSLVKIKPKKTARIKSKLKPSAETRAIKGALAQVQMEEGGYQDAMTTLSDALHRPPELLIVSLEKGEDSLVLRVIRIAPGAQVVRGTAVAPVLFNGRDLEEALLFTLEEVLLGDRTDPIDAPLPTGLVAAAVSEERSKAEKSEVLEDEVIPSEEKPAATPVAEPEPIDVPQVEGPVPVVAAANEAEEDAGNGGLLLGGGLAAGGLGALVLVGATATLATVVIISQGTSNSPNGMTGGAAASGEDRAQQTGTRWAVTGFGY